MSQKVEGDCENPVVRAFARCRDALVRSIVKMSVRPEDVDDILQETFIRTYMANDKKAIRSPQDYLFVVSRNLVVKGIARRSREINAVIDDAIVDVADNSLDKDVHEKLKCQALGEVLSTLPEKKRQAILLRKVYGFSAQEIARKMGISKSSVDKYIASGIKQCEESLDARGYNIGQTYNRDIADSLDESQGRDRL